MHLVGKFKSVLSKNTLKSYGFSNNQAYKNIINNSNNIDTSYIPQKGDILFLLNDASNEKNTFIAKHTGIVESVSTKNGYRIITAIEGNVGGNENSSRPYYKTSKVSKVTYILYGGKYYQFNNISSNWVKNSRGNSVPKSGELKTDRIILGFYPTNLYN